MRYLKDARVLDRKGKEVIVTAPVGNGARAVIHTKQVEGKPVAIPETRVSILLIILDAAYTPNQAVQFSTADKRLMWKMQDMLEGSPQQDGYYAFEDAHYAILKRAADAIAPLLVNELAAIAPAIEDFVNAMPTETPAQAKAKADAALIAEAAKATTAKQPVET